MVADRRVVLITGAGASRDLGRGEPMPLMADWGTALAKALDDAEPGLADACHLANPLDGETFEQALGDLLTWGRGLRFVGHFAGLAGPQIGQVHANFRAGVRAAEQRWPIVFRTINRSLFGQFGLQRIDTETAQRTYRDLFSGLRVKVDGAELFCATTNYDPSLEAALDLLGRVELGFEGPSFGTKRLAFDRFEPWNSGAVPVVHLHGAVGWYRDDAGGIVLHPADQEFDDRRTPVVLYPDPAKNPFDEVGVRQLWSALHRALGLASDVVILGYSLHDRPLVEALGQNMKPEARLTVTYYDDAEVPLLEERLNAIPRLRRWTARGDVFVSCHFGPGGDLSAFANGRPAPPG